MRNSEYTVATMLIPPNSAGTHPETYCSMESARRHNSLANLDTVAYGSICHL
jgi:hypothetical protein